MNHDSDSKSEARFFSVRNLKRYPLSCYVLLFIVCLLLITNASLVKLPGKDFDIFFYIFIQHVFKLTASLIAIRFMGHQVFPKDKFKVSGFAVRGISASLFHYAAYYGFSKLPIGDCNVIAATSPVFTTLFGRVFLKEVCGCFEVFIIILTLLGIILVMQPPLLFGAAVTYTTEQSMVALLVLFGAVCGGVAAVTTRRLRNCNIFQLTLWDSMVGIIPSFIIALIFGDFTNKSVIDWAMVAGMSVISLCGVLLSSFVYKLDDASKVSVIGKAFQFIMGYFSQICLFDEIPNWLSITGSILVGSGIFISGSRKFIEAKSDSQTLRSLCCLETALNRQTDPDEAHEDSLEKK